MSKYETHIWESPRLPFIFNKMHLCPEHKISGANWHENIELLYILSGSGSFWGEGEQSLLSPGDLIAISSNKMHDISTNGDIVYHYLIIDRSFCLANHFDSNKLEFYGKKFRDEALAKGFTDLENAYRAPKDTPFRTQEIRAIVLSMATHLCRYYSTPSEESANTHLASCVRQAIAYIRQNYKDPFLSLDQIADSIGVSKYYFAHKFKDITHHTCVWYINMVRCTHAKTLLLETELNAGEIGKLCGFNSHSYFTRTFHDYIGLSPNEYRMKGESNRTADESTSST